MHLESSTDTFREELKQYVAQHPSLVSAKPVGDGLLLLKYKRKVFYNNLWNKYLEECRGTIVDHDYNIVSRPFKKIYNYGIENRAPRIALTSPVTAFRKVNGFMVAITWWNDDILVSTTGTTDSEFVGYARELIGDNLDTYRQVCREHQGLTFLFEAVHPSDPHIIPEETGLYLLGYRLNEWGDNPVEWELLDIYGRKFGCMVPERLETTLGELLSIVKTVEHEGFVWYGGKVSAKIKSPYYLVSKFLARIGDPNRLLAPDVKQRVDEEYYGLVDYVKQHLEHFSQLSEQDRLQFIREYLYNVEHEHIHT